VGRDIVCLSEESKVRWRFGCVISFPYNLVLGLEPPLKLRQQRNVILIDPLVLRVGVPLPFHEVLEFTSFAVRRSLEFFRFRIFFVHPQDLVVVLEVFPMHGVLR